MRPMELYRFQSFKELKTHADKDPVETTFGLDYILTYCTDHLNYAERKSRTHDEELEALFLIRCKNAAGEFRRLIQYNTNKVNLEAQIAPKFKAATKQLAVVSKSLKKRYKNWDDRPGSDLKMISRRGTKLGVHKDRLEKKSRAFAAILKNESKATIEKKLKLPNSDEALRVLIKHLYSESWTEFVTTSELAYELFEIAYAHGFDELVEELEAVFMRRAPHWFSVRTALRLYTMSIRQQIHKGVFEKAVEALKSMKRSTVTRCVLYKNLQVAEPEAADQLLRALIN